MWIILGYLSKDRKPPETWRTEHSHPEQKIRLIHTKTVWNNEMNTKLKNRNAKPFGLMTHQNRKFETLKVTCRNDSSRMTHQEWLIKDDSSMMTHCFKVQHISGRARNSSYSVETIQVSLRKDGNESSHYDTNNHFSTDFRWVNEKWRNVSYKNRLWCKLTNPGE